MLRIRAEHLEEMVAHARAEAPNECVGLLFGRDGRVERIWRGTNVHRSPFSYQMDPGELLRAFREMEAAGLELVGIYHSHPASPAYPSRTDVARAYYPEAAYVIVSLQEDPPAVRAFRIQEGRVTEEDVMVE
jgi:proteasome lid subunit RPN8/RPN11